MSIGRRPRILLVTPLEQTQGPLSGTPQRLEFIRQGLCKLGDVTVFVVPPDEDAMTPAQKQAYTSRDHKVGFAHIAASRCFNLKAHKPSPKQQALYKAQKPQTYDIIFLHRLASAWWTGNIDPDRTIIDIDDIVSQHYGQGVNKGNPLLRPIKFLRYHYTRWAERNNLNCYRYGLVCSDIDKAYINHPKAQVLPNSYMPTPEMDQPPLANPTGQMLFVGVMGYPPNSEGMAWFVNKVLPLIREKRPEAAVTVVGRCEPGILKQLTWRNAPGVIFEGTVPQVAPFITNCQFEVCPLLSGMGTRIKIVESLAYAKPVISTTIGAYGLKIKDEQGLIRCDDPQSFANACLNWLEQTDACQQAGKAGQAFVKENLGPTAIARTLQRLVGDIMAEQGETKTA